MSIHPAVIIGFLAFAGVVAVCGAWVAVTWLNARAQSRAEAAYRAYQAEQQRLEAQRYEIILQNEQRAIEVRR